MLFLLHMYSKTLKYMYHYLHLPPLSGWRLWAWVSEEAAGGGRGEAPRHHHRTQGGGLNNTTTSKTSFRVGTCTSYRGSVTRSTKKFFLNTFYLGPVWIGWTISWNFSLSRLRGHAVLAIDNPQCSNVKIVAIGYVNKCIIIIHYSSTFYRLIVPSESVGGLKNFSLMSA